jgi:hypothetical protein
MREFSWTLTTGERIDTRRRWPHATAAPLRGRGTTDDTPPVTVTDVYRPRRQDRRNKGGTVVGVRWMDLLSVGALHQGGALRCHTNLRIRKEENMLVPVPHLIRKASIETVKNTLHRLWRRVNNPRNTRPEYLDHLKV